MKQIYLAALAVAMGAAPALADSGFYVGSELGVNVTSTSVEVLYGWFQG